MRCRVWIESVEISKEKRGSVYISDGGCVGGEAVSMFRRDGRYC